MVLATVGENRVHGGRIETDGRNVGGAERALSLVAGGALAAAGLRRRGAPGVALALLGAELLRRGATGHCSVYQALGVTTTGDSRLGTLPHRDVTGRAATVNARRAVKIEESVTVHRPARELYDLWRDFSILPRFMEHLESVVCTDDRHAHWVAGMPGGKQIEWESEIVNDIPGELIAWKTVGEPDVAHAGSVHFRRAGAGDETEVRLVLDYEPPAASMIGRFDGSLGEVPDALIREELQRFKAYAEAGGR